MSDLTVEQYEHQAANCDGMCSIDHDKIPTDNPNLMPCVTCPFCKELVDAVLTPETISCPSCLTTVKR